MPEKNMLTGGLHLSVVKKRKEKEKGKKTVRVCTLLGLGLAW
jgi:hypothetical protein